MTGTEFSKGQLISRYGEISVVETKPLTVDKPYVIVGLPEVGLVGVIATSHIVGELKMTDVGYLDSEMLPPVVTIHDSEPKYPLRIFQRDRILLVISEVSLPAYFIFPLTRAIVDWAKSKGAEFVVGLSGLPTPNRTEIEKPSIIGIATTPETKDLLSKSNVPPFEQGVIVGAYALLLRESLRKEQPNITLFAESHHQFPDPGASASILEALSRILNVDINVKALLEKAEEIRLKARELMRQTQQSMEAMSKAQERGTPSVYV
ncbi:MAG: proteasome assembly chaperone family protein [Candidatus Bathyarchaeia archaeon]